MKKLGILSAAAFGLMMSAPVAFADDITISVVGPMTGQLATIGDQFKQGAQAADGVKFVDGHACSGSSIPASAVYAEAGTLMMSPASSNPVLTDAAAKSGWPTIMRLYTRDDAQGAFIGPWIAKKYAGKNVVVLHDKSAYGQGVADAVKATMNAGGLKEVDYEGINAGEKDYSALVTKLKELKADVVYFGGYHPEAGLILRQAAEQNVKFQLIMPDSIASPEFWQ
ncbi:MAG: branched-chain amino acid ABC transporter substrate-binding protein, partial [Mesorhizobium sp.]